MFHCLARHPGILGTSKTEVFLCLYGGSKTGDGIEIILLFLLSYGLTKSVSPFFVYGTVYKIVVSLNFSCYAIRGNERTEII